MENKTTTTLRKLAERSQSIYEAIKAEDNDARALKLIERLRLTNARYNAVRDNKLRMNPPPGVDDLRGSVITHTEARTGPADF